MNTANAINGDIACFDLEKAVENNVEITFTDDGKRIIPATYLPKGWEWRMYDDGSGGLYSPENKSVVEVDFTTSEYRRDGKWYFMRGYPYDTISSSEFMDSMEKYINSNLKLEITKPKTLQEKLEAAKEKVKAQETKKIEKTVKELNVEGI